MSTVWLPAPTVRRPDAVARRSPFHLLAKPTGAICNLDCTYCFFLSKELLYEGSRFRMADELLQEYIRQLIEAHGPAPEVTVAWQGGEPTLMGLDFFRRSLEYERLYARPGQRIVNTLQTNGTLIDAEWARFFRDNDFLVGLSVDGPRAMHDAYRVDKGGKPTFDRVMRGLDHLRAAGVDWNVLTTLHDANAGHGREVYAFLREDCGARHLQFIPIVERTTAQHLPAADAGWGARAKDRPLYRQEGEQVTRRSITGEQYGRFLIDVFEDWVRRDVGTVYVQMFDVALANWYGTPPSLCVHSETCGRALALEHNGDIYSCDHFVEPRYLLGNIGQRHLLELVDSPEQQQFGQRKRDGLPGFCRECDVRFACHGGCPKDRFDVTPDGEPGLNHLCSGFKKFFHHVDLPMRTMAALLRQNLPPALIMRQYAAGDARRPHNAPCPCGGGRKWARCHGRRPHPTRAG
ncbi:anaerobic sulfatase maturase [Streptomyces sp. NPDC001604]|uniref:anaerobic sulfatase maturase n=1 Tax=Streptomyces sp. NPDC001604 TaxID=3364593 RepID=UPI00368DE524